MQVYISGISMESAVKVKAIGINLSDEATTDVLIFNLDTEYSSIAASLVASTSEPKPRDVTSALLEKQSAARTYQLLM